jgi:hypothetical protein
MIGVVARAGENAPSGTYELGFANGQLTFSDVHVPTATSLETGRDYAVPFVHLRSTDTGCESACDLSSIDIAWQKLTANGWQASSDPQAAHIDLVVSVNGKRTSLAADLDAGTSALAWSDIPVGGTGILQSELAYVSSSEICYVAVSYVSELGMQMTMSVANPSCY